MLLFVPVRKHTFSKILFFQKIRYQIMHVPEFTFVSMNKSLLRISDIQSYQSLDLMFKRIVPSSVYGVVKPAKRIQLLTEKIKKIAQSVQSAQKFGATTESNVGLLNSEVSPDIDTDDLYKNQEYSKIIFLVIDYYRYVLHIFRQFIIDCALQVLRLVSYGKLDNTEDNGERVSKIEAHIKLKYMRYDEEYRILYKKLSNPCFPNLNWEQPLYGIHKSYVHKTKDSNAAEEFLNRKFDELDRELFQQYTTILRKKLQRIV